MQPICNGALSLSLALVFAYALAAPVAASEPLASVLERIEQGDDDPFEIVELLEPYADVADPRVAHHLALARWMVTTAGFRDAPATAEEYASVIALAERALALGHGGGGTLLWLIHANGGPGIPADPAHGLRYLEQGAALGDAGARLNLAIGLLEGRPPFVSDEHAACAHFTSLHEAGEAPSIVGHYLGLVRLHGLCGQEASRHEAEPWFRAAAEAGNRESMQYVARILWGPPGTPGREEAVRWFRRAADNGDAYSVWRLGVMLATGEHGKRDPEAAVRHFRDAIELGHSDALTSLAVMHASGDGVPQDFGEARALYLRAAAQGSANAHRNLALMSLLGQGTEVDPADAWAHYLRSLSLGNGPDKALASAIEARLDRAARLRADALLQSWQADAGAE